MNLVISFFSYMQQGVDALEPSDPTWDLPDTFNATFDAWFRQMGYPIVTVSTSDDGSSTLLSQKRFLRIGDDWASPESSLDYLWNIPVFYINGDNEYKMDWIRNFYDYDEDYILEVKGKPGIENWLDPEANAFVVFNYGGYSQFQNVSFSILKILKIFGKFRSLMVSYHETHRHCHWKTTTCHWRKW